MELNQYFLDVVREDGTTSRLAATEEQAAIINIACSTTDSIMINALAGAAKTSTLQFLAKYMPIQPVLCLAFNKKIAEEMASRLPGHIKCQTLNSLGHGVWARVSSKKISLDKDKVYRITKEVIEAEKLDRKERSLVLSEMGDLMKLVRRARTNGYIPDGVFEHAKRLISVEDFWAGIADDAEDYPEIFTYLTDVILTRIITESYNGTIDFDDQIYMPALFGGNFPQYPLVMVDETQDLSPLNHEMLKKLFAGRLIAVGDPWQSIYGFRGAVSNGMRDLVQHFRMTEMNLSISFRCPKAVVRKAQTRVPHMRWADWAEEGEVSALETWTPQTIPDGAAVICRNNAPLLSLAFALIRGGRGIELRGMDIGASLIKALKKLGDPLTMTEEQAYEAIDKWEKEKLTKARGKGAAKDRADCLRIFVDIGGSLKGAISYAETIFAAKGPIQLLSGHKSKGLEWNTVFHLDPWRVPSPFAEGGEALNQEYNVRYVIETRAKRNLFLVNMRDYRA